MLDAVGEVLITVTWALDGDTYLVTGLHPGAIVRLAGFDAPERSQARGQECLRAIKPVVEGMSFLAAVREIDQYGRVIAQLFYTQGHRDLAIVLLKAGLGWCVKNHAPDVEAYEKAEKQARQARKGLWQDLNPIAPWIWRAMMPHFRHNPMGSYHRRHRGA